MSKSIKAITPDSLTGANRLIQGIGEFQVEQQDIVQKANEEIKKIRNEANRKFKIKAGAIRRRLIGLFIFYQENWKELTQEGRRKIYNAVAGPFGSRIAPRKVNIRNKEKVIKNLKARNLEKFIRLLEEIDKEAILAADPDLFSDVSGIKITQDEIFIVTPAETGIPVSETVKKLKKFPS